MSSIRNGITRCFGDRLQLDLDNAFYIVAEGLINSFREGDDYEGFKLATIVNFGVDTKIEQEEFLKGDANELAEKLYQEATQNYERKLDELRKQAVPVFNNIRTTQGSHVENVVVPFTDGKKRTNVIANLQQNIKQRRPRADQCGRTADHAGDHRRYVEGASAGHGRSETKRSDCLPGTEGPAGDL